jgi:phosphatidylserine/phosphatidylglycerophosphate/cardiolipin synthase-like enzyme
MSLRSTSLFRIASRTVLFAGVCILTACGGTEPQDDVGGDEENASFGVLSGKADGSGPTACQLDKLLAELNGPLAQVDALKEVGVHTRAAKSISAYVLGADGSLGTWDDGTIETLEQLDALKYVGPAALSQLLTMPRVAQASCGVEVEADVIFSPQPSDATHLVRVASEIDKAQHTLDIAMYSFSNSGIFNAIERAIDRGVEVRVVFEPANKDKRDPAGTMSARLEDIGADVRYINKIMHHKFALIDGPRVDFDAAQSATLISGSANWSNSAGTRYDENTVFIKGSEELNMRFQREFNLLWDHSRDLEWGTPKTWVKSDRPIEDVHIPDNPFVTAAFTSSNFRTTFSSRYGETFSRVRGKSAIAEFIVEQIEDADTSILVASGHLRSRPIAEALIAKRQSDPNIEIRVYLDGQEFISDWWHTQQEGKLADCLVSAGASATKTEDCYDKGFYFGYALGQAGVDVRYKAYSYRWHYKTAAQMHHKYLIFDNDTVVQGSYNLSDNAEHNTMENMVLYTGAPFGNLTANYIANFESMWKTGRDEELYSFLMEDINAAPPGSSIPIVFDSMSLTWDQVSAYKSAVRDRCPAINTADYRDNPDKRFSCKLPN